MQIGKNLGTIDASAYLIELEGSGRSLYGAVVELTPPSRIVEAITFEAVDPAFSGEMIMEVVFEAKDGGTLVSVSHKDIPSGIRPEDNEIGTQQTLEKLARYIEAEAGRSEGSEIGRRE